MSEEGNAVTGVERDRQMINEARAKGKGSLFGAFTRLSGPGWLQSAITLGGGSLASSLYMGILGGFALMWLQPLAMILGVIMLSAIAYVTLSTGERPFDAINRHVSPVLGWGWALATMMANLVWALPQFSLGTAAIQQNLLPGVLGADSALGDLGGKLFIVISFLTLCTVIVWSYDKGSKGVRFFEIFLKVLVGLIVLSFFGVVIKMTLAGGLEWGRILTGFIPNPKMLMAPATTFNEFLAVVDDSHRAFWTKMIVDQQRDVMIAAAATAVGINMTFLLPYSMLKRGWDKDFRGLAIFDLSTGLFIPFILATSCVVIAAAARFHTEPSPGLIGPINAQGFIEQRNNDGDVIHPGGGAVGNAVVRLKKDAKDAGGDLTKQIRAEIEPQIAAFEALSVDERKARAAALGGGYYQIKFEDPEKEPLLEGLEGEALESRIATLGTLSMESVARRVGQMPEAERTMAAMLIKRSVFDLANSLEKLTGAGVAQYVFGLGVVGMAISSIIILMLINGFVICEMFGLPSKGWPYRIACFAPGVTGALGPFFWKGAAAWLAVPTSVFGMVLIPIAYFSFFFVMNNKKLLGENMPRGTKRIVWNTLMLVAAGCASFGSLWSIWSKTQWKGIIALIVLVVVGVGYQMLRKKPAEPEAAVEE